MMRKSYLIRTQQGGQFGPPSMVESYDEYRAWLRDRYARGQGKDGGNVYYYGIAQRINEIAYAAKHGAEVTIVGPFATAAADELRDLSDGRIVAIVA